MLAILAGRLDVGARALAARWSGLDARVLTPDDLCSAGWRYRPVTPGASVAVVAGERVAARAIRGVLVRLSRVDPGDLAFVAPDDRPYVAAEITAFLVAWLSSLTCPVVNRPTPSSLPPPPRRPP